MNIKRLAASGVMLAMLLTGAVMAHGETADFGNPADFKTGMEENFYVQEGSFRELDTIKMASGYADVVVMRNPKEGAAKASS